MLMNWYSVLNPIVSRSVLSLFIAIMLVELVAAAPPGPDITTSISNLCASIKSAVPVLAFAMLLLAGIIYAGGQIMGAETRARANVWATAMLTGGVIGLIIAASAPYVLQFFNAMFSSTPYGGGETQFTC